MKKLYTVNRKMKPSTSLLLLIVISLSVTPAIALGEGNRNLFLIGVMALSPFIIVRYHRFYRSYIWLLLFMISIVLIPLIHQPTSMRWSTVMYTFMFGLTFIAYVQLLHQKTFTVENYLKLLKYLIYAYFVVLLIQQFCVLTGLPIFNLSNYNPANPWKLNSLAPEPSHSARIVALLMYSYISVKEVVVKKVHDIYLNTKEDKWIWISFLWTMVTMGSGTAFLFIAIVLLKFVQVKKILVLFTILGAIVFLTNIMGITSFERTYNVFMATITLDVPLILEADHSAAMRIVPMLILIEMFDFNTLNFWFGYGIDYVKSFISDSIPGVSEGFSGGGLVAFWTDYGFISFFMFFMFSFFNIFSKKYYLNSVFWFMLILLNSINSQILWLTMVLLFTNVFFLRKDDENIEKIVKKRKVL